VACNLLDVGTTPKEAVLAAVRALADGQGISLKHAYTTGREPEELCRLAQEALGL
jgi:hypothetical protein